MSAKSSSRSKQQWFSIKDKIRREVIEIEHRSDLASDDMVSQITNIACVTCAGVAIQPIPFADIFVLTPIQAYFASRIAAIRGVPVSEASALDLIKQVIGIIGLGIIAQQIAIGIWKIVTFGMGGLLTIPLVYGLTHAVMKVVDAYYSANAKGEKLSDEKIKAIWKEFFSKGKKKGAAVQRTIKVQRRG